jgi:hypothetical protein
MPWNCLRGGAMALSMLSAIAVGALPAVAAEDNLDADAGIQDPAEPIGPAHAQTGVDAGNKNIDVSVDRDPAPRMPQVSKPDVSVEAPGTNVTIDRN